MSITINESMIKSILPNCKNPSLYVKPLQETIEKFNITTIERFASFIAQVGHESGHLNFVVENLNYSAEGLLKIFGKYFNENSAKLYARQPIKIASRVYANRMGNGDEISQEGYKYRGRGAIQTTGKNNYTRLTNYFNIDFVNNPDLLSEPKWAVMSAGFFWHDNKLNELSDSVGTSKSKFINITKKVNGGTHGHADREAIFSRA